MKRTQLRTRGNQWCQIEIELADGRLSICGSAGKIVTSREARKLAREYWESFFQENRSELHAINDRMGTNFRSARSAARYVLQCDGEFHGLDIHKQTDGRVFLLHSCGQIREELLRWFPECEPFLRWHLNDMHAECEHQERRGETWQSHPGAVCPECGWKLGHAWARRELPAEVVAWAEGRAA